MNMHSILNLTRARSRPFKDSRNEDAGLRIERRRRRPSLREEWNGEDK